MRTQIFALASLWIMGAMACHSDDAVEQTYAEVLAMHDEVMPKMSTLSGLEMTIQETVKDSTYSQFALDSLHRSLDQLGMAEEAMWEWMNQFKKPEDTDKEAALRYLSEKKMSINQVGEAMNSSMESAQALIDRYKK